MGESRNCQERRRRAQRKDSSWQGERLCLSETISLLAVLRVLLGLRKCGFSQEGASELLLSQHTLRPPQPGNDRGQAGRPEEDGRRAVVRASPKGWETPAPCLPSWSREGFLLPRPSGPQAGVRASQFLLGPGLGVRLPSRRGLEMYTAALLGLSFPICMLAW